VELGWNRLVALDPEVVLEALRRLERPAEHLDLYGGGRAGEAIVRELERFLEASRAEVA
jgi:hypothetical protein